MTLNWETQSGIVFKAECFYLVRQVNPKERRKTSRAGLPVFLHTFLGHTNYKPTERQTHTDFYTAKLRTTSGLCFKMEQCRVGFALTDICLYHSDTFLSHHCIHRKVKTPWDLTLSIDTCGQLTHEPAAAKHCVKHSSSSVQAVVRSRPDIH